MGIEPGIIEYVSKCFSRKLLSQSTQYQGSLVIYIVLKSFNRILVNSMLLIQPTISILNSFKTPMQFLTPFEIFCEQTDVIVQFINTSICVLLF